MYTPVHPSFTTQKWGVRGYKSHGHVILMVYGAFQSIPSGMKAMEFKLDRPSSAQFKYKVITAT